MKKAKKLAALLSLMVFCTGLTACANQTQADSAGSGVLTSFPKFQGTDFEGNQVDETMFSQNKVTLLNVWFNECSGCVDEIPALEEFNKELKAKGAEIVGLNLNASDSSNGGALTDAKEILKKQGASFRNIYFTSGDEALNWLNSIISFPSNVLIDQNGNMIGEPMPSNLGSKEGQKKMLSLIDKVAAGDKIESDDLAASVSESTKLYTDIDKVLSKHLDLWNSVKQRMDESSINMDQIKTYTDKLKAMVESCKDKLTEEELKTVNEDIEKINVIEQKMIELENKEQSN
ncbi:MAG: TlpA family protein disulfide reductase [Erysipelotrichaceae bacterium]|nr:TlpA family protein disulfide reductase [Erysipelotrichaceae bacterium]